MLKWLWISAFTLFLGSWEIQKDGTSGIGFLLTFVGIIVLSKAVEVSFNFTYNEWLKSQGINPDEHG